MAGALDGVRVLEASAGWSAAALAGRLLAELGADVVAVEPPEGDPLRAAADERFEAVAAGKRSAVLSAAAIPDPLLRWGDILLADEWGARLLGLGDRDDLERLSLGWPHLVACAVTPFGLHGPLRGQVGGELAVQATSGVMACTGYPDRAPTRAGAPLGAHLAGIVAAAACLAALRTQEAGHGGQGVDISVHDCLVSCLGSFLPGYFVTGEPVARLGNRHPMGAPWNAFPCRDGWIVICAFTEGTWTSLLREIGRPDLAGDARYATPGARAARVEEVEALVSGWTRTRTVAEAVAATDARGIPAGPVATVAGLLGSEQFRARGMIAEVPGADGRRVRTVGPLFKLSATPGCVERGAPGLGAATADVMRAAERVQRDAPALAGQAPPPLAGVRVLEMGSFTAGPVAPRVLAALGADVIKLEPRRGEGSRLLAPAIGGDGYLYHLNNTDKRSATLEIGAPGGRDLFLALARQSHVFLENFAPGTAEAWGIGPAAVLATNERLVYCSVSGFGHRGALAGKRAFDNVIQAMAGLMAVTGEPGDPPVKVGLSVADLAGAHLATVAILAALRHAERTGRGQHADVSMHDVTGWLTAERWPAVLAAGSAASPDAPAPGPVPAGTYRALGGGLLVVEVRDDAEWLRLCGAMKRDDLAGDPRFHRAAARRAHAREANGLVAAWVAERSVEEAVDACQSAGVSAAPVLSIPEVAGHPHTLAREMIAVHAHERIGPLRLIGIPHKLLRAGTRVTRPAPDLGAHTDDVYRALAGRMPADLAALRAAGVI